MICGTVFASQVGLDQHRTKKNARCFRLQFLKSNQKASKLLKNLLQNNSSSISKKIPRSKTTTLILPNLPEEIWRMVFTYLDSKKVIQNVSAVCKNWLSLVRNDPGYSGHLTFTSNYISKGTYLFLAMRKYRNLYSISKVQISSSTLFEITQK